MLVPRKYLQSPLNLFNTDSLARIYLHLHEHLIFAKIYNLHLSLASNDDYVSEVFQKLISRV